MGVNPSFIFITWLLHSWIHSPLPTPNPVEINPFVLSSMKIIPTLRE